MTGREFIYELKQKLPNTQCPILSVGTIPLDDGLWVKLAETTPHEGDPVRVARVTGILNEKTGEEIQICFLPKDAYTEEDIARAVALIHEADLLPIPV